MKATKILAAVAAVAALLALGGVGALALTRNAVPAVTATSITTSAPVATVTPSGGVDVAVCTANGFAPPLRCAAAPPGSEGPGYYAICLDGVTAHAAALQAGTDAGAVDSYLQVGNLHDAATASRAVASDWVIVADATTADIAISAPAGSAAGEFEAAANALDAGELGKAIRIGQTANTYLNQVSDAIGATTVPYC